MALGFGLTSRLRLEKPGAAAPAVYRRVRRHLDWLLDREVALDLLTGAAVTVVLAFAVDAGRTAVWLGAWLSPIVGREVRHLARDWSRRKRLSRAAVLALISAYKQDLLPDVARRGLDSARRWASGQLAPAAAASVLTVAGFTATEATLGKSTTFFGGDATIAVLGFYAQDGPASLVEPGGVLRACRASEFTAAVKGKGGAEGNEWSRLWTVDGERWVEKHAAWPPAETYTVFYTRNGTRTGQALPDGRWTLTLSIEGKVVGESTVTLVNDAC